ncbi:hypothetical protein EDB19DRAFT_306903 [Suillus lakei]|nr:hypothetical protein EDB19DRAFT_306903 [Suillus lakei]
MSLSSYSIKARITGGLVAIVSTTSCYVAARFLICPVPQHLSPSHMCMSSIGQFLACVMLDVCLFCPASNVNRDCTMLICSHVLSHDCGVSGFREVWRIAIRAAHFLLYFCPLRNRVIDDLQ